ncbi:hypothetical protein, partial [Thermovibrio sp.]
SGSLTGKALGKPAEHLNNKPYRALPLPQVRVPYSPVKDPFAFVGFQFRLSLFFRQPLLGLLILTLENIGTSFSGVNTL